MLHSEVRATDVILRWGSAELLSHTGANHTRPLERKRSSSQVCGSGLDFCPGFRLFPEYFQHPFGNGL